VIKLRLRRMGAKKRPFYRIVAAEHSSPRDGRFIEVVGHYDPLTEPPTIKVDADRVQHWLSVGAKPSPTVEGLLRKAGAIDGTKIYTKEYARNAGIDTAAAPAQAAEADATA
jgi:small subunit ribosomal protein S16